MSLQALIDATPAGGRLDLEGRVFDEAATPRASKPITISRATVRAVGAGTRNRAHFRVSGPGVVLNDIHTVGANPAGPKFVAALEAQHGFDLVGAIGAELNGCTARDVYGDGLYVGESAVIGKTGRGIVSTVVKVRDFEAYRCGRMGIAACSAADVDIEGFKIDGVGRSAIDIEPPHGARKPGDNPIGFRSVQRVRFAGGDVRNYANNLVAAGGIGHVTDLTFEDIDCDEWRVWIGERSGVVPFEPRARILFRDIRAETGGDGGAQQATSMQQAQMVVFNWTDVTLERVVVGRIRQNGRKAWLVRGNENTRNIRVIDCTPSPNGSGLIHPDSTDAPLLPELPRITA